MRDFDRGRRDRHRCRLDDGAAETLGNVPGHGLSRGLAPLVASFPSMAIEQDPERDRETGDGEESLHVVRRPGPPELLERFDVIAGVGERAEDRHDAKRDAEEDEDGPGRFEGPAFRWLLGSGVAEPGPGRHTAALEGTHGGLRNKDGPE